VTGPDDAAAEAARDQPAYRRLFFAIWPDGVLSAQLHEAAHKCLVDGRGRLIAPENLHVTLAFLGDIDGDKQICFEQAASQLGAPGFSLALDLLGYWPRKQILWAGCSIEPPALGALVTGLQTGLSGCGYAPETRPFHVHVTLARHVRRDPFPGLRRSRREHAVPMPSQDWQVREFSLVESDTRPEGARYSVRRTWALG
jgi:2'-5' RNA ligase